MRRVPLVFRKVTPVARGLTVAVLAFACSGCVATKYKSAKPGGVPPVALNLAASQPPAEAIVHSVIVYQGPGSWKREAYWDEYVLSVINRADGPLAIESADLIDRDQVTVKSGADPWILEGESKTWWKRARSSEGATLFALGAGTVAAGVIAVGTLPTVAVAAGASAVAGGASIASVMAGATVVAVALPVYAISIVAINQRNKGQVVAEFNRRRFALPATLASGQTMSGSVFFRITPSPRQLVLRGRAAGQPWELTVSLAPLADLHLRPQSKTGAAVPAGAGPLAEKNNR